ncbi:HAD family hydrolase [Bacillus sp. AY3-1]|uniref:HAD family hydrolase n=1 Tax=Bacillus thuringiensis serovar andalousiensis TaxID=257985 RepID=A0A6H0TGT5_BACTU|nr:MULTISPECIES: HAD family hydrolase [Bacillus cereus group]KAA0742798.1 HAD family hydrolase [Bacillus sp. AY3-1]MCP9281488.1 HAD family hydrolase [Bacillus wiedmannii]PEP11670.1 haloacid dehalogenase [Bacillus wiedmannii]QIW20401.1 HAD family hydrolase [Bacillus thuringiensis serovar andalousiensis]
MEKVKAILFDKDGTLMDFHSIWIKVAEELVAECIKLYQLPQSMQQALLKEIGVDGAFVHPRSAIAAGTSLDVAKGLCKYITSSKEEEMHEWVSGKLFSLMYEHRSYMKMTADLPRILQGLKDRGFILGVVTADDFAPTELFLKQYQLESFFDYVVASDTFPAQKPDKRIVESFCEKFHLEACEVAVVGDTPTDLYLARNGGNCYAIGVLSGTGDRQTLEPLADLVVQSVGEFISHSGELIWEQGKSNV